MMERAFRNFYYGFLFIMVDFRFNGIDILPDIVGYAFFAAALGVLAERNFNFTQARKFNIIMIILSIFSIYERPSQSSGGFNISIDPLGVIIGIVVLIFSLLVVYHLFMGIKAMADELGAAKVSIEAEQRWKQYLYLQLAVFGAFLLIFIPPLAVIYVIAMLIVSIALTVKFMGFMNRCGQLFSDDPAS